MGIIKVPKRSSSKSSKKKISSNDYIKKLGHKGYRTTGKRLSKNEAKRTAVYFRKCGDNARVVKLEGMGNETYTVFFKKTKYSK